MRKHLDEVIASGYNAAMQSTATWCPVKPAELKRIREGLELTQAALADELGVHRVTIAKWEAGDRGIPEPVARLVKRIQAERQQPKKRKGGPA